MLNRIAAAQNYTTKEGFSMRSVAFKALAVGLVGLLLIAAGPLTARAQPVLTAQISVSPNTLNFTGAGSAEVRREVTLTITATVQCPGFYVPVFYINWWAEVSPQVGWLTVPLSGSITDGCEASFPPLPFPKTISRTVPVTVTVTPGGLREGTYNATITFATSSSAGISTAAVAVTLQVGQPGPGQVRLSINAEERRRPNDRAGSNRQIRMELTIDPPTGGWMSIVTPYFQNFPQGTRIRLVAPESVDGLQFDHWEAFIDPFERRPCNNFTLGSNTGGRTLEGPLCSPQTIIIAVYVRRSEQPPPPGGQLITLFINAWRLPGSPPYPDLVPLRIVIRRPEAACPQPMGQCPGDEVIPFYLFRLDGAMPFTRQLPANTAIQIEALPVVGRAFVRFDRQDQGRVVSSDSVNPVMYSVLPCWGAQPCNAPNGPLTVTAVYR
jgi:hypothetical protein